MANNNSQQEPALPTNGNSKRKSVDFLPKYFRTQANQKILSSTLDQLVQPGVAEKINGYFGRTTAKAFRSSDTYIEDVSTQRQNRQLEPATIIEDDLGNVTFYGDYPDFVNQIENLNGSSVNQSLLNSQEYYAWNPNIDWDKFSNFRDYYWLPNGPQTVTVFGKSVDEISEYTITTEDQDDNTVYKFDPPGFTANPTLTLYKGQTYRFKVRCKGHPISFTTNRKFNDAPFKVIQLEDGTYDAITPFNGEIQALRLRTPANSNRVPGTYEVSNYTTSDNGKNATFRIIVDASGNASVAILEGGEGFVTGEVITFFDADLGNGGAPNVRFEVANVYNSATNLSNRYLQGLKAFDVNGNEIVPINIEEGTIEFTVPFNAPENLFYVSSTSINTSGFIKVYDIVENTSIDINEVIGKRYYKSSNGVDFTNGLKVKFAGTVTPEKYANSEWYVEGVGDSIVLIDEKDLTIPALYSGDVLVPFDSEPFDRMPFGNASAYAGTKDYIVINRASKDRNAWTRYNRWFHKDVIEKSARYNNQEPQFDLDFRALRPIVEFEAGLKLFNYGTFAKKDVDLIDTVTTDAFSTIEGSIGYNIDGVSLASGMRVLFAADTDRLVNGKVYTVNFITIDNEKIISLVETEDSDALDNETVLIRSGSNAGSIYYFNGDSWHLAQSKTAVNQSPLFDMFDETGNSFSDIVYYTDSTFRGNRIFGYKVGELEAPDSELGFPLSYKNIENLGDIVFEFPLVSDSFQYSVDNTLQTFKLEAGYLRKYTDIDTFEYQNGWTKADKVSEQAIVIQYVATETSNQYFDITVLEEEDNKKRLVVYVNNDIRNDYTIEESNSGEYISFNSPLNVDDNLVIKIYSTKNKGSNVAYYEMAHNLERNPLNENPDSFTLGEVIDHVNTITESLDSSIPLRDAGELDQYGRRFVKHSGPINLALYHIVNKDANIVKSLRFSRIEYAKFKRQFLQTANSLGFDGPIKVHVDKILQTINAEKTEGMPFYFSDMVPYSAFKHIPYVIEPSSSNFFALTEKFDLTQLSAQAVLVYHNGIQLVHERDYVFTDEGFIHVSVDLANGDTVDIYEYSTTDGSFIPPTPSKLGLYPAFYPEKVREYFKPTQGVEYWTDYIQGHDGSLVKAYDDFRDDLLLDLERRIYNNIKQKYNTEIFDIHDYVGGEFRDTKFTRSQINKAMTADFIQWNDVAGGLDYTDNEFWTPSNRFTFNYASMNSRSGATLPGFWRGVYKQAYDTDRPHTHPWEMLGFFNKPKWWEDQYGPAPYTNSNLVMWEDLEKGIIREPGKPAYVNNKYVRPNLTESLPVDSQGNLLDPITSDYVRNYVQSRTKGSFTFGDHGVVETAWRRSAEYPFALITSWVLNQPAKAIGIGFDLSRIKRNVVGNLVYTESNTTIRNSDLVFPNTYNDNVRVLTSGLVNYVYNFLASNIEVTWKSYYENLKLLDNKLSIKVGGFTEKEKFKLILDSRTPLNEGNVFVPSENYKIILNKSAPVNTASLSGVIIEKRSNGFVVTGYDKERATFTAYQPIVKSNDPVINVGGISEEFIDWDSRKQYVKGQNVRNGSTYYRCTTSHVSTDVFDLSKFSKLPSLPQVGGRDGILRREFSNRANTVPYGTIMPTIQDVVDFILGYEAYLKDQGFIFDYYNQDTGSVEDWTYSVKEFLFWTTQNWAPGSVLTLSPGAQQFKFSKDYYVVDDIFDDFYGYSLLKSDGKRLARNFASIARNSENEFGLSVKNSADGIYAVKLPLVQIEHVVLLDNETVFNDVIYDRAAGYRQERIKVAGYRSDEWSGGLNIPGFIYDEAIVTDWEQWKDYSVGSLVKYKEFYYIAKTELKGVENFVSADWERLDERPESKLIPNFDYRTIQFTDFYDLDSDNFDSEQQRHAQHLIGYQKRQYLQNIINDDVSQYKFYQGFIQDKGTKNALTKLFDALNSADKDSLEFYEEWALRVGQYGAVDSYQEVEFIIDESKLRLDPQPIELVNELPINDVDLTYKILPYQVYVSPKDYNHKPFPVSDSYYREIKDAGYVYDEDVVYRINDISDILTADVNRIGPDDYIWITGTTQDWDVVQHVTTNYIVTGIEGFAASADAIDTSANPLATITISTVTDFKVGDIIGVRNLGRGNDGFYQIEGVRNNQLDVRTGVTQTIQNIDAGEGTGYVSVLRSVRSENIQTANAIIEKDLKNNQKLWIDGTGETGWSVIEKQESFLDFKEYYNESLSDSETHTFANAIAVSEENANIAISNSSADNGSVDVYQRPNYKAEFKKLETLEPDLEVAPMDAGQGFGENIAMSPDGKILVIGSPYASNISGHFVGDYDENTAYEGHDIVKYQENYWRAARDINPAQTAVTYSTFDSYAFIEAAADLAGLVTKNTEEDDPNVTLTDIGDITLILQGIPYFPNQEVDHLLIRAPYDQYRASKPTDLLFLKWNSYTNLQRGVTAGNPIPVWRTGINETNTNNPDYSIPDADFINNGVTGNGSHTILSKVDYVLYLTAFNNPPAVGDTIVNDDGAAIVESVYIQQDKMVIYLHNTNGVFPEAAEIRNNNEDVIGEYTMPNFKYLNELGGYWKVQTNLYVNADEFTPLKSFGTPAYGLVYQDLVVSGGARTDANFYTNSLDTVYPSNTDRLNSYITALSHRGIGNVQNPTDFPDHRWILRLPKTVESQVSIGESIRVYLDTQSPSYDYDLVGLTAAIPAINAQAHEITDFWEGWIDFTQLDKQQNVDLNAPQDPDTYTGDFFEPQIGDIIVDQFTRAEAEVTYYLNRNVNQARAYIKAKTGNFAVGSDLLLNTVENGNPNQRRMGVITRVSTADSVTGLLAVLNHPNGTGTDFPIPTNSYSESNFDTFAYINKEYWVYQENLAEEGRDLPPSIPSTLNNDWSAVYNAPVDSEGTQSGVTNQGAYTIYRRFDSRWIYQNTYTIPETGAESNVGKKVAISQQGELYRIYIGSKDSVYLIKHGTDTEGNTFDFALDIDKRYRGAYDSTYNYVLGEIVYYNNNLYQAKTFLVGVTPTDADKWTLLSYKINYLSRIPNDHPLYADDQLFDPKGENVIDFTKDLAVSRNGQVLAIAVETDTSVDADNKILIYRIDNGRYVFHQEIIAPTSSTFWANSIDLSKDGNILVVGEPGNDVNGFDTGKVYIYSVDNNTHFVLKQTISGAGTELAEQFGYTVSITDEYIGISSFNGDITVETRFDRYLETVSLDSYVADTTSKETPQTTFDDGFTNFVSTHTNSGSVTIYQDIEGHWIQAEELEYVGDSNVDAGSRFGQVLVMNENNIYVGLPNNPTVGPESANPGSFLDYVMEKGTHSWQVIRKSNPIVDTRKIKHAFLYNTKTNQLITYLDFIDPVQGKILGIADQEISFKSYIDLARYNATNFPSFFSETNNWEQQHVGKLWWDLSTARFKNAYQDDPISQSNFWNTLVEGYSIDIYEWVESDIIPSEWDRIADTPQGYSNGISGQSKYGDDAYSIKLVYNSETESFSEKYFFWVKDKFTLPTAENRTKPAGDIARLIADPRGQGYRYVTLLSDNRFVLVNCNALIADQDVALNVGYYTTDSNMKNIHFEYQILSEGLETSVPKADLERKWIHSLVGYDDRGREVPDKTLPVKQQYGTLFKPRQSWFINRQEALKQVINRANITLLENIVVDDFNFETLNSREEEPLAAERLYDRVVETEVDLQFLGTAKVERAVLRPIQTNGTITRIAIENTGRGYNDLTYNSLTSSKRYGPSYTVIGDGEGLDLDITINNLGQITRVDIINGGKGYTDNTIIEIRPLTALVQSDSTIGGRWALYYYDYNDDTVPWKRNRVQSFDTTLYWDYSDWYATGYNQFTRIDYAIDQSYQLYALDDQIGNVIKINNIGSEGWLLLKKVGDTGARDYTIDYETIGRQNGTIQLSDRLYNFGLNSVGFDNFPWDGNFYDTEPVAETRNILTALKDDIFVDNLAVHYNELFFASVRYVLSEQLNVDWVFKTSFIKAKHNVGELEQKITYQNDNLSSYNDYIEEVKPYKTNIREYLSAYEKVDNTNTLTTDFDIPPFYDETQNKIVPARVTVVNDEFNLLDDRFDEYPDKNWKDNVGFKITGVNIYDAGAGYTTPPVITFVGGGGTGAKAKAYIGAGKIRSIEILDPGTGYLSAPEVVVSGSKRDGGKEAVLSAVIGETVVRSLNVNVKFDRVSGDYYITELPEIQQFTGTAINTKFDLKWPMDLKTSKIAVFVNDEKALRNDYTYRNVKDTSKGYDRYIGQIEFTVPPELDAIIRIEYNKDPAMLSAQDRIQHRYYPTEGMPGVDLGQLMEGVDYGGVEVRSFDFEGPAGWDTDDWYTSTWDTYDNTYEDQLFVADGSTTVIELTTPLEDGIVYNVYRNGIRIDDPNYPSNPSNPNAIMPSITGNGTQILINLGDYDVAGAEGDRFIVRKITSDGSFLPDPTSYDTDLGGGDFLGNAAGVNAEDIIVDGDLFVTSVNSGGPEELVPGQVFDTVDMTVYERTGTGTGEIYNQTYITSSSRQTYPLGILPSHDDAVLIKLDNRIVQQSKYTLDYDNLTVTFNNELESDLPLNIITVGISGQNIIDVSTIITDGENIAFETNTQWTTDLQFYTRVNGVPTNDLELVIRESENGFVEFLFNPEIPPAGTKLDYEIYSNRDQQNYSRVTRDSFKIDGSNRYTLSTAPSYKDPASFFVVVLLDDKVQRPGYQKVYTVTDANKSNYGLEVFQVPLSSIRPTELTVYLNGRKLTQGETYNVATGSSSISFITGLLNVNDKIEIFLENGTYTIEGNELVLDSVPATGTQVDVIQFTNHNIVGIERTSYDIERSAVTAGTDEFSRYHNLTAGKILLNSDAIDTQYVWISKNLTLLTPSVDYKLVEPRVIQLNEPLSEGDDIDIMHFAAPAATPKIAWKQFKDILNRTHYKRFDSAEGIYLTQELQSNDLRVYVNDATLLPEPNKKLNTPGVIWIGKERIEYFAKSGNIIRQLRRGTHGTGTADVYPVGDPVYSMGINKNIPYRDEIITSNYTATEGQTDFALDFTPQYGTNEFEVFAVGKRLRKTELQSFDPTLALDSPEGDITLPPEFSVNGSTLVLETPLAEGQRVTVVRKIGKLWSDPGTPLKDADNDIANFLRGSISELPK